VIVRLRRLPAHALNGVSVAAGVGLVQVLIGSVADASFTQSASIGAVAASLPHLTGRAGVTLRRTLVGGALATISGAMVHASGAYAWLQALSLGVLSFAALLGMAWGPGAGPVVFSVIIGMVFALARPNSSGGLAQVFASVAGIALYSGWAWLSNRLLERRYRALAVADAIRAAASLLRARATVLSQAHAPPPADFKARFEQLQEGARLAQTLQVARDGVHSAPTDAETPTQATVLWRLTELRETALTAQLDLELFGHDHAAYFLRGRLAMGLRLLSELLDRLSRAQQLCEPSLATGVAQAIPDLSEAGALMNERDPRLRLLPTAALRMRLLAEEVEGLRAVLSGQSATASLPPEDLPQLGAQIGRSPLAVIRENLSLRSPVLRHALRSALAFVSVHALAQVLPWATRPYWLLLSVAVVLRGTFEDTITRRNARIGGTVIGCVLVTLLVPVASDVALKVTFAAALGVAHAFVNVRYLVTATSATVMALLQAHFSAPNVAPLVVERLLDTVLGALIASSFGYVLPSWERRTLPEAAQRAFEALRGYAASVLAPQSASGEQRFHRQRAYDALAVVSTAVRRSSAEPKRVRAPIEDWITMLDHAQRLMAHLSSLRLLLVRRAASLPKIETRAALERAQRAVECALSLQPRVELVQPPQPGFAELPGEAIEREPLPWLLRRLDAAEYDASEAGRAASRALTRARRSSRAIAAGLEGNGHGTLRKSSRRGAGQAR
jgi:uncharacterized membrane protein YccC